MGPMDGCVHAVEGASCVAASRAPDSCPKQLNAWKPHPARFLERNVNPPGFVHNLHRPHARANVVALAHSALRRPVALLAVLATLLLAATAWHEQLRDRLRLQAARAAQQRSLAAASPPPEVPSHPHSFVDSLPASLSIDEVLRDAQRHAAESGLQVQSLEVSPQPAAAGTLQLADITLAVQGRYAALLGLLAELSDRHPGLVIRQLSMRRAAQDPWVDARVSLALAARPPGP